MLQFITHKNNIYNEVDGTAIALAGGCRWIQLRMKEANDEEFVSTALRIAELCGRYNAKFIIDDRIHLVRKVGADGVHLGKNDMPLPEARKILPKSIIGATANTLEDMIKAVDDGADYIGLGPFRYTTTKSKLSPILGLEGYRQIMAEFLKSKSVPVVAIGGISIEDIPALMKTCIDGVAVSGSIINAKNPIEETKSFIDYINKYHE